MRCPCCEKEMKYIEGGYWDFLKFADPTWMISDEYKCDTCNISYKGHQWKIPEKYNRPTEKQIKTVKFINQYLGFEFEPLLKTQCWRIINKYLKEAQKCKQAQVEQCAEDMRAWYDEWDYF